MFFLSVIVIITLVTILHLLLHFVVRKDNMLVVFGSVVFAAISMTAVYFFVISQWDIEGYGRITVPLITYIVAEVFYLRFTFQVKEIDIGKSVEARLEKIKGQHKSDLSHAFWCALSGRQDKIAEAIGHTEPFGANECFAVPCWPFVNSQGKPDVYWGETLRIGLLPCNETHFNGLRWQPIENDTAIVINDKVVRLPLRNTH